MNTHKKNTAEQDSNSSDAIPIVASADFDRKIVKNKNRKVKYSKLSQQFSVVGIGASAGGLAAFEAFFNGLPADRNLNISFVLVQHLAPDHKSILTDIIKRYTKMQVFEVEDGMVVRPNCAYIIPPNRDMAFINGSLQLFEPVTPRGLHMPIDFFFRSLANDQRDRAICIILSGTGSDGTLGLRAVKGEGGMAIAQSLDSAEYDGMPRSAIATGLVDYELPPSDMGRTVISYITHAYTRTQKPESTMLSKTENKIQNDYKKPQPPPPPQREESLRSRSIQTDAD